MNAGQCPLAAGVRVLVETGAGVGSGFSDEDYRGAGAEIMDGPDGVFEGATTILKVKEPLPAEFHRFREGQTLFTYLHLAANPAVADLLMKKGITSFAYENVVVGNQLPLLQPMSEIAGRMAAIVGAYY
ncbi:MAG: alanine dehydrogenase, partial [Verrucomicrobiales bacterium]